MWLSGVYNVPAILHAAYVRLHALFHHFLMRSTTLKKLSCLIDIAGIVQLMISYTGTNPQYALSPDSTDHRHLVFDLR